MDYIVRVLVQEIHQVDQGVAHMTVSYIPGDMRAFGHVPVIVFDVLHDYNAKV